MATWDNMTTSSEYAGPSAQQETPGVNLLPEHAREAVEEIKAANAALHEADEAAEEQAEVVADQARRLVEVTEEALEELKEARS